MVFVCFPGHPVLDDVKGLKSFSEPVLNHTNYITKLIFVIKQADNIKIVQLKLSPEIS